MVTDNKPLSGKSVSLVLGSGGARGLAHIGVIQALEHAGADIKAISGSSMGALVGGIHAAGRLGAYRDWVCGLEQSDVFALVDWTFSGGGLIRGRRIIDKLGELVGQYEIEDLEIDFTAVAVDLDKGRQIWLDRGPLFDAIRASIAIPGVFTPHEYRGRILIDGGILNPVPIAPILRSMNDLIVVVDVNGPAVEPPPLRHERETSEEGNRMLQKMREFMDGWRGSDEEEEKDKSGRPGLVSVMMRALDTMEGTIARYHMAMFDSDIMINVPKNACMVHEFHRAAELIELGEHEAASAVSTFARRLERRGEMPRTHGKSHGGQ